MSFMDDKIPVKDTFFPSLGEMMEYCEALPGEPDNSDPTWKGGHWDEVCEFAYRGWPKGMEMASTMSQRIADRAVLAVGQIEHEELTSDVSGVAFDVGGYCSGVPEHWVRPHIVADKKEVRLVTNVCASAGVPAATLMKRGIAVAALVLALKAKGHPVTVDVGSECGNNRGNEEIETIYTRVLDANSPIIDIDRVIFALAHPGFFRHILFAIHTGNKNGSLRRLNYGRVHENQMPENIKNPSLYLGSAHLYQVERWQDGGEAWILEEYKRQTQEVT